MMPPFDTRLLQRTADKHVIPTEAERATSKARGTRVRGLLRLAAQALAQLPRHPVRSAVRPFSWRV